MPAPSQEHSRLIRQLESITELSRDDRDALATLPLRIRSIAEKRDIVREGARPAESCLVTEGMVCRYKMLSNGRRQILSFHHSGDMPDLESLYLKTMDHTIASVTAARVAFVPHEAVKALIHARPGIADALSRLILVDASIYREWIANIGRRSSMERVAHVICECFVRMRALGLCKQSSFELPLTQIELGDATGLSVVHVNRVMKELRRLNLIETNGGIHAILDWEMLQETADFDPGYLHLRRQVPP
jgi:CRP-like cAMP-binding protein